MNDPVGASARLKLAVCPAVTVCEVGEPDAPAIEKSGAAWTISDVVTLFVSDPAAPCICNVYVPAAMLDDVVMVSVEVFELPLIEAGLNVQFAPLGKPVHERVSVLLNPKIGMAVTVEVAEPPAVTGAGVGAVADNSRLGGVVFNITAIPPKGLRCRGGHRRSHRQ